MAYLNLTENLISNSEHSLKLMQLPCVEANAAAL